jgi:hypothetical protein
MEMRAFWLAIGLGIFLMFASVRLYFLRRRGQIFRFAFAATVFGSLFAFAMAAIFRLGIL